MTTKSHQQKFDDAVEAVSQLTVGDVVRHEVGQNEDEQTVHRLVVDGACGPWVGSHQTARQGPYGATTRLHGTSMPEVFVIIPLHEHGTAVPYKPLERTTIKPGGSD